MRLISSQSCERFIITIKEFEYECKALDEIKRKACLLLNDNRYIVKPDCKSNMRYFTQLLNLKNQEHLKSSGLRMKSKNKSNDTDNIGSSVFQSPAQVLPPSSPLSQSTITQTTD
ncbi:unnamed protein product [Rotaria socialis]|nr:unnamed protein product [Rotaria socialis]CAF4632008.1 unnamed protein product [Rotaria socialis]